jgi:hypothetical protein
MPDKYATAQISTRPKQSLSTSAQMSMRSLLTATTSLSHPTISKKPLESIRTRPSYASSSSPKKVPESSTYSSGSRTEVDLTPPSSPMIPTGAPSLVAQIPATILMNTTRIRPVSTPSASACRISPSAPPSSKRFCALSA